MINSFSKQTGSVHVVIIIILIFVIFGLIGFVFWQNFISKDSETKQGSVTKTEPKPQPETTDPNEGYLVLKDWKIKFKIPATLSGIKYYEVTARPNSYGITTYYEFSTQRVEDLGGRCAEATANGEYVGRLASISRTEGKSEQFSSAEPANNNEPVGGYYYTVTGAQAFCADGGTEIQRQDRDVLYQMLLNPIEL